jgi:hypothetical protein
VVDNSPLSVAVGVASIISGLRATPRALLLVVGGRQVNGANGAPPWWIVGRPSPRVKRFIRPSKADEKNRSWSRRVGSLLPGRLAARSRRAECERRGTWVNRQLLVPALRACAGSGSDAGAQCERNEQPTWLSSSAERGDSAIGPSTNALLHASLASIDVFLLSHRDQIAGGREGADCCLSLGHWA